ncbi:MAG: hypothetical protein OSB59_05195 [Candidatus Poseidoniia archaeon]|nr:hypothetical protein [Candidatus Poseidoniia archaeon]
MTYWNDFNNAEEQNNYDLIPNGTIAKVRLIIRPGGYDDMAQGWTGGYATLADAGAVYLNVEYAVLEGKYTRRKLWGIIGLYSPKGPEWANMGITFIKAMINSARKLSPKDVSEKAVAARYVDKFSDIDGIEFIARIDITKDQHGKEKNEIKVAITPDHKDYAAMMNINTTPPEHNNTLHIPATTNQNRPSWA